MLSEGINDKYSLWLENTTGDILKELQSMNESEIEDAFYRDLSFGTGGLRGTLGAGTNRMNVYVVGKASQGLADYLGSGTSVVIGYDSRIKSDMFAFEAASVLAANGVHVYLWPELLPVPTVSYAVRQLNCDAGVMITASHNPSKYNGYKVYGHDGCQITTEMAAAIFERISSVDIFNDVHRMGFIRAIEKGKVTFIDASVLTGFISEVKNQSVLYTDSIDKNISIVYSPLNGAGFVPVTRVLKESGFTNITVVEEQKNPDGNFPTCPYPNPEVRGAMELGLEYCKKVHADLLIATDPDCDRVGIAVKDGNDYRLMTANEVGLLLLDYICSQRIKHGKMPKNPVFVKTIVTTDLAETIAKHYGVKTINVLTGFKFIGEVIGRMEAQNCLDDFIFSFEESYGYLTGTYVRDKDGVDGAYIICEMFAYYMTRGISLLSKLNELYKIHGYCMNTSYTFDFEGSEGAHRMSVIMDDFRKGLKDIGGQNVVKMEDYSVGLNDLPKSNVIKYYFEGEANGSVVIRPSGTEPKLKVYISVITEDQEKAALIENRIINSLKNKIL